MKTSVADFLNGLTFGFDVGTGSIGYAVRRGSQFLAVGVLICESEGSDLSKRRDLRRQRRTLRGRKYRRQWFSKELAKLGLPPSAVPQHDPISLRVRALTGEKLAPDELHAALTHLVRRRGYTPVPWANSSAREADGDKAMEEGEIKTKVTEMKGKVGDLHPCQFLAQQRGEVGKSPKTTWARKIYWPRELLEAEFRAIAKAQAKHFPKLADKADWLLFGDTHRLTRPVSGKDKDFHVFFTTTEARNPGVLGLRWPRFDNRGPALDSLQPVDEEDRPLHVVRKNKEAFTRAQWELALINFRVIDCATGKLVVPDAKSLARLRDIWESGKRNKKKTSPTTNEPESVKVSEKILAKWEKEFAKQYRLVEGQQPLTPQTGAGRARYSSLTLNRIYAGEHFDPPQPILRRKGENPDQALNRYFSDIKHPLVRHRLVLFRRLLALLVSQHGKPDMLVLEAVRSLALGQKAKNELNKRNEQFRKERELARGQLSSHGESISRKAIQRYRLWQEAKGRCPFCLNMIERTELGHGADIEHLVPRSIVDCNEAFNLTVAHIRCNRELKGDRTPLAAFGGTPQWEGIKANAERCFSGRKLEIFLSPNAEEFGIASKKWREKEELFS